MLNFKKFNVIPHIAGGNFVCVDFSSDNLKIAHLRASANKKELVNLISRDIRGLPEADLSKLIKSLLRDMAVKNQHIVNVIPSPLAITRNIEVPSCDPNEIEEIVNLQASRLTPYAREDIIIDYVNIGTYRKNYTKLFLITVSRNIIKRQLDILWGAGIRIERVYFSAEGITRFIFRAVKLESEESTVNILHIDNNYTDFIIALKGKIIFVRGIPIGIEHLVVGKEQYQLRFLEEVKKSLEAYIAEDIEKPPQLIILTGAVDKIKELESFLNMSLRVPARSVSYFKHLCVSQDALKAGSSANLISFLNVAAPLIAWDELKLNLIPEEIKFKKLLEEKGKDIVNAAIFIMAGFVLLCAILISKIYFKGSYLKHLEAKYGLQHQEAQKLEMDFNKVKAVRDYLARRGYSLLVLDELYNVVSSNVQLADIKFDRQGKFSIKGSAESMAAVFSLIDDMGKSPYFKDVKSKYTTKRREAERDVVDFEIVSLLKEKSS